MSEMTPDQILFLNALAVTNTTLAKRGLPAVDKEQDKARQQCRKLKLAEFGRWNGDKIMGWRITDAGRAALLAAREGQP